MIIGLYILLWGKNKEIHKVGQGREDEKDTESGFQGVVVEDNNCESRIP